MDLLTINKGKFMRTVLFLLAVCLLGSSGCADVDNVDLTGLDFKFLTVNVTTVGANLDTDGYMLSVTGEADQPIGINELKTFPVSITDVTVELRDIAPNCAANANPQSVSVRGTVTVSFLVECN